MLGNQNKNISRYWKSCSSLSAEEAYLSALLRVKKLNFSSDTERVHNESALTFQKAVRSYENDINDVVDSRRILKEKIKLEIDVLTKQKVIKNNALTMRVLTIFQGSWGTKSKNV